MIIEVVGKEIEKIKGDFESYLNGLNMVGEISYSQYSELYDEGTKQIQKAYELGKSELEKENVELIGKVAFLENDLNNAKAQIEKMKWHKVSDGDLPKDRHNVYVVYLNGYYQLQKTIASFRHKYWVFNGLKTECEIIAWCELPKWEIKEND